jgi:hypothetical protein
MTARQVYEADRAVLDECTRRGVTDITVRKLERWRRYLPDRVVEHRPGQRGSHTSNPPHYVDQVLTLDAHLKAGTPLRQAPIHLFAQGFSVKINNLRDAYTDLYTHLRHGLTKNLTHIEDEPTDRADRLATLHAAGIRKTATGQRWAKRARQLAAQNGPHRGDDPDALFTSALSAMFTWMIAGEQPSAEGITEALSIAGLNDGQDPEAAGVTLAAIHLEAILTAIDRATEADWTTARQSLDLLAQYTALRHTVDKLGLPDDARLDGLTDLELDDPDVRAVLIPVALVFGETWLLRAVDQHGQFAVVAGFLAEMPDNVRLLFQDYAARLEEGPAGIPIELQTFLVPWAQTHPDEAALFGVELPTASPR